MEGFVPSVHLHRINSLLNTQQRHLGRRAFLLKAVESVKIRCSHRCLVLRKTTNKSYPVLLLIEQWGWAGEELRSTLPRIMLLSPGSLV